MKNELENYLAKNNLIPKGIDYKTRTEIIDLKAIQYNFYGYKYSEGEKMYENSCVAFQIKNTMVEMPFWIYLFKGASYREYDTQFVAALSGECVLDEISNEIDNGSGSLALSDMLNEYSTEIDGLETILDITEKFKIHFLEEDESDENHMPLIEDNASLIPELAEEIISIKQVKFNYQILKDNATNEASKIKEIGNKYIELAALSLHQVHVVYNNTLEALHYNLTKDEAEEKFIELCNYWCNSDGVEEYKTNNDVEDMNVQHYLAYLCSPEHTEASDDVNINIEQMN